ncbi:hypothetical protein [Burkholderia ubonensis]|uniref:hypothetical protein n=1 Tax=Burkholderia ubonensis TaxID=101571 RepID=UPI0012FAA594|nr:hypothetical protein [Burkholderia ubonensis]
MLTVLLAATLPLVLVPARASETVTFTVEIGSLRYPYASPADNEAALVAMVQHSSIVGHYWKSTTVFKMARCMIGVTCFPSPHLEQEPKDYPISIRPRVVIDASAHKPVHITFELPVSHRGAPLDSISLVLPLKFMWQQPSVQRALKAAEAALPDYKKTRYALESDASVSIPIDLPKALGEPGPIDDHCAEIPNPLSWSSSGVVGIRTLAEIGSKREVQWSLARDHGPVARLGTEKSCATWRPEEENSYLWRSTP